ncbi:DUF2164 domain-containing protein [Marinomonas sp. THO17]|uniref:DUF2164 domain-containing protein n=1 Tax=Marinomonas sp. THO17 TaxID=3149048 RepID=UPI00336BBE38
MEFTQQETDLIVSKSKKYFTDELDSDIGDFEAEFLLAFFSQEIGPYFYNKGLADANQLLLEKSAEIGYLIQELEQPVN